MRHANGSTVCELYGAHAIALGTWVGGESMQHKSRECLPGAVGQGPIVAFNLFRSCGAYVGYRWVPGPFTPCRDSEPSCSFITAQCLGVAKAS